MTTKINSIFLHGDEVTWTSQSQASETTKIGIVIEVIPAGIRPSASKYPSLYRGAGLGSARNHESYVVSVRDKDVRGRNKIYWPRVSKLAKITS